MKTIVRTIARSSQLVAPRAGAWVETGEIGEEQHRAFVAPRAVRGLKSTLKAHVRKLILRLAPVRVAWVEILLVYCETHVGKLSHPVRVRGLKLELFGAVPCTAEVAPVRVRGVETGKSVSQPSRTGCRTRAGARVNSQLILRLGGL